MSSSSANLQQTVRESAAAAPAIVARGLCKRFGTVDAVAGIDLDVARAAVYGFLGPNGSGKSTTIRMLCGLLAPSAGSIRVLGHEVPREADTVRLKLGYMTQKFSLWEDLTARENLRFLARVYTLSRARAASRLAQVLEEFRLTEFADRAAGTLSGGRRQRLALAAATLHEPQLLMLDEPTSAVDPQSRRDFWQILFALAARGTTILVSTHYMDEAERCHRLAIMSLGRIVAEGTPRGLVDALPFDVVEVESDPRERAQTILSASPRVRSVAQLGQSLHALIVRGSEAAVDVVSRTLLGAQCPAEVRATRGNLEDVFVAATQFGGAGR
jgi:ABC-2 type transport system ATP-binding protein